MSRTKEMCIRLLWVALLIGAMDPVLAQARDDGALSSPVQVILTAPQTSISWDSRLPEPPRFELPLLYLHHGAAAADPAERTLTLHLAGLPGGTAIQVEATSWHEDPETRAQHRAVTHFDLPLRACTAQQPCTVQWTLDPAMPGDLYRLQLRDDAGRLLWENPDPERPDFAALDTWDVDVPGYTVRIYYAALFPFARGEADLDHRPAPGAVRDFIIHRFAPLVAETWQTQFGAWGLGPVHPGWDADGVVEIIFTSPPFAILGGTGTYTVSGFSDGRPYPERRIWMLPAHSRLGAYDSLENGYRALLAHEFFHLVQRNVLLGAGCSGEARAEAEWRNLFIEAQAAAAAAIQYPELELRRDHLALGTSTYGSAARQFLSLRLKASYVDMATTKTDREDLAIYWRFLYEQHGSLAVWRAALEEMACRPAGDLPVALDEIMDAALARADGPVASYEESLVAFARANYALRLDRPWCAASPGACGIRYDDPDGLYAVPPLTAERHYLGDPLTYRGALPASFGSDLIEIRPAPAAIKQPVQVVFRSAGARFSVQLWRLDKEGERPLTAEPETLAAACSGECRYTIPAATGEPYGRLAVIVVRLDPQERTDPVGSYELVVEPAP